MYICLYLVSQKQRGTNCSMRMGRLGESQSNEGKTVRWGRETVKAKIISNSLDVFDAEWARYGPICNDGGTCWQLRLQTQVHLHRDAEYDEMLDGSEVVTDPSLWILAAWHYRARTKYIFFIKKKKKKLNTFNWIKTEQLGFDILLMWSAWSSV